MPICPNCGSHLTHQSVRMMIPKDGKLVKCPDCEENNHNEWSFRRDGEVIDVKNSFNKGR